MKERIVQPKKVSPGSFSIPTLRQPTRGFGSQSSGASSPEGLNQPLIHDISRIPLRRPQTKLTINQPGDIYEQEADAVAKQVMERLGQPLNDPSIQRQEIPEEDEEELQMKSLDNSTLQRESVLEEEEDEEELQMKSLVQRQAQGGMAATPDLEASINQARGGGKAIALNIRQPMEQAFGADFSGVKVHTDGQSDELNQSIQARAFTTGQDVFFRQGEYNPGSRGGQELLAHELTHVVQQNGGKVQREAMPEEEELQAKSILQRREAIAGGEEIIQRDFDSDRQHLTDTRNAAPENSLYRRILEEALQASELVKVVNYVGTSGNVQRRFTAEGNIAGYILNYQGEVDNLAQRIGNFVHELTHIAVEQAYQSDHVNYANEPERNVPEPQYGDPAVVEGFNQEVRGIKNEEARQTARLVRESIKILSDNLIALNGLVEESGMDTPQRQQVSDKLMYGAVRPNIEYDTVVNQIYVWCKSWGVADNTRFYQMLEAMVEDAYNRRQNRNAVAQGVDIPDEIPQANANSCCYITTACMLSRGLEDDCEELMVLRFFRDDYLLKRRNGKELVEIYYRYSPKIVEAIDKKADAAAIYESLYDVIRSCVHAIKKGNNDYAYETYCAMVIRLKEEYLPDICIPSQSCYENTSTVESATVGN
jgi:Domain of unknown function (DUF4157)